MKDKTGAKVEAGTSVDFKTGSWRSMEPNWDDKRCIQCMFCVIYCPEGCIPTKEKKRVETDFNYCKGCGICAVECPVKCIEMKRKRERCDAIEKSCSD